MRFSLKSAGVRWLGSAVILGTAAISASVAVKIESFTGLMEKLLVRMMSAPQTLGTASTSINASRSMRSPGLEFCRVMYSSPFARTPVCMNRLKESWTSSGVRPYSRCASAWMSWQLVCTGRPYTLS